MTSATVRVSKPAKRATPWSSCTTMSPVRSSVNERSAPRAGASPRRRGARRAVPGRSARRRRSSRCSGNTASFSCGATKPSRSDAAAKRSDGSSGLRVKASRSQRVAYRIVIRSCFAVMRAAALAQPRGFQPAEVVRRALALAAAGKRDDRPVARAHELLELRLGLAERARGRVRGLRAQLDLLAARQRRQPDPRALGRASRGCSAGSRTGGARLVAERRAHVAPVVVEHRLEVLLGGDHQLGVRADQVEQRAEALDRQQLGDVRALGVR